MRLLKKLINERPGLQKPPGGEAVAAVAPAVLVLRDHGPGIPRVNVPVEPTSLKPDLSRWIVPDNAFTSILLVSASLCFHLF